MVPLEKCPMIGSNYLSDIEGFSRNINIGFKGLGTVAKISMIGSNC